MAVLRCPICGGELEFNDDMSVGVCKYCDSTIAIPKELDKKGNLYNRAVFLRQANEFDKAIAVYEDILKEDNSDAEAHWGLLLARFGIEYVEDPITGERMPTCHRTQNESILTDADYQAAMEFADVEASVVYAKEAKRIQEIQTQILEISKTEPPYDIFICYKESDETGNRTEESVIAQDLYYELLKKDYKVFFARKTLEDKLGKEYEPVIFAALNSAKVMIVLGTKPEHFNAVWVKNEWSRFMKMSNSKTKTIIPAYRGMSPYELPMELSSLQSLDMNKIGFMQELLEGIERVQKGIVQSYSEVRSENTSSLLERDRLVEKCETYFKLDNYEMAEKTYRNMTERYPEDYRGWWGLIICKTHNLEKIYVEDGEITLWFTYIKKLADEEQLEEIKKTFIEYLRKVALSESEKKVVLINAEIQNLRREIEQDRVEKERWESEQKEKERSFTWAIGECSEAIRGLEIVKQGKENKLLRKEKAFSKICIVTVGMLIVMLLLIFLAKSGKVNYDIATLAIISALMSVPFLFWYYTEKNDCKTEIHNLQNDINELNEEKERLKSQNKGQISNVRNEVGKIDDRISEKQQTVSKYLQDIASGKESFVDEILNEKCNQFNI